MSYDHQFAIPVPAAGSAMSLAALATLQGFIAPFNGKVVGLFGRITTLLNGDANVGVFVGTTGAEVKVGDIYVADATAVTTAAHDRMFPFVPIAGKTLEFSKGQRVYLAVDNAATAGVITAQLIVQYDNAQ